MDDKTAHELHPNGQFRYDLARSFLSSVSAYTTDRDERGVLWVAYRHPETGDVEELGCLPGSEAQIRGNLDIARRIFLSEYSLKGADGVLRVDCSVSRTLYAQYRGLRPLQFVNAFEGVAWAILGQQISVQVASTLKNRIAEKYGTSWRGKFVFPSSSVIARLGYEDLVRLHLSRAKAQYLVDLANLIERGLSLERFYRLPTEHALEELVKIKGIGPWTARYVLLRVFGHVDVIPFQDVALQHQWSRLNGLERKVCQQHLVNASGLWGSYAGLLAFYLWVDRRRSRNLLPGFPAQE